MYICMYVYRFVDLLIYHPPSFAALIHHRALEAKTETEANAEADAEWGVLEDPSKRGMVTMDEYRWALSFLGIFHGAYGKIPRS